MKKSLLFLLAAASMTAASAQKITFKHCDMQLLDNVLKAKPGMSVRPAAPAKVSHALITPEGTMKYYSMSAVVRDLSGLMPVLGVAEKLYFTPDGNYVYFGSLFPSILKCEDLWVKGVINGDDCMIDCYDEVYHLEDVDPDGTVTASANLHIGELLVDEAGNPYGLDDVHFTKEGDRFYIDYSDISLRPVVLFELNEDETVTVLTTAYNHDIRPYEGNTTLAMPPATAQVSEYVYSGQDTQAKDFSIMGHVAIDGNDYYFDSLLPETGHAWLKGTRSGSTITLENDQFLGTDISYYLYYNGFKSTGFDSSIGQYVGEKTKLTFNVDAKGVITLNNANRTFPCAFFTSGNQFYATFQNRIAPYEGDKVSIPSDPYDLKLVTKYFEKYGECSISFCLDNISTDGEFINPELLYYCMWLDGELYTFNKKLYPYLHEDVMEYFPYGYKDLGNYDIYLADDGRNVICYREDMFVQCGIQAVYRLDGKEYRSNIVYIDDQGNIEKVAPENGTLDGMKCVELHPAASSWYDLSGRRSSVAQPGQVYIKDGRRFIAK